MALKPISMDKLQRIVCLVIANYGMGKTSLLRTILGQEYQGKDEDGTDTWTPVPEGAPKVCVLTAESGLLSVRDLVMSGHVEGYEIESFQDMRDAYMALSTDKEMQDRYRWVFIDSLTEISDRCMESAKKTAGDNGYAKWEEYEATMKTLVKGFRDLPHYSTVFTCLPSVDKDEQNRRFIAPAIAMKSLKEKLPSYFDEVFFLDDVAGADGQPYRTMITQPYNRYPAKDRSGRLAFFEKPDLRHVHNKILGGK